jgi:hypothetical protein
MTTDWRLIRQHLDYVAREVSTAPARSTASSLAMASISWCAATRRPERVIADLRLEPTCHRPPADHAIGIGLDHRLDVRRDVYRLDIEEPLEPLSPAPVGELPGIPKVRSPRIGVADIGREELEEVSRGLLIGRKERRHRDVCGSPCTGEKGAAWHPAQSAPAADREADRCSCLPGHLNHWVGSTSLVTSVSHWTEPRISARVNPLCA